MERYFEFASITEMRWLAFRSYMTRVFQMEAGSFFDSPRSARLIQEQLRQASGQGMGYNKEPRDGPLWVTWKASEFSQIIRMYESNSFLEHKSESIIEFKIEITGLQTGRNNDILEILDEFSRARAGFSYILSNGSVTIVNRHKLFFSDETESYSFILPLLTRQHAFATILVLLLRNLDIVPLLPSVVAEPDEFVSVLLSKKSIDSSTGVAPEVMSPEGIPEKHFFKDLEPENALILTAKALGGVGISSNYYNSVFETNFLLNLAFNEIVLQYSCKLQYSNIQNPIFFSGENTAREFMTNDQTLCFYMILSKTSLVEAFENSNSGKVRTLEDVNEIQKYIHNETDLPLMGQIYSWELPGSFNNLVYELPISLSQIEFIYRESNDPNQFTIKLSNYISKQIDCINFVNYSILKNYI